METLDLPTSHALLQKLGYDMSQWVKPWPQGRPLHTCPAPMDISAVPKESAFDLEDIIVEPVPCAPDALFSYTVAYSDKSWDLNTKVALNEKDVRSVACIAARFAPPGSTVNLQADTHGAGNVYVGMIMSFGHERIPINMVSGDIGCGLSIVPVVGRDGKHMHESSIAEADKDKFYSFVLATIRKSLKRGKAAEAGTLLSRNIKEAMHFYGSDELTEWLQEMRYVLEMVGLETEEDLLNYIGRFAQSLGSSGNHFMEMSVDDQGYLWWVVHSGSRSLGSKVYEAIAGACRLVTGGLEIATGPLAVFYVRAYDVLNKFAKLNRILCALAVSDALGFSTEAEVFHKAMKASFLFAPAMHAVGHDADAMLSLMSGLTHNGLKAYVSDKEKKVLFVMSKGAIAMTKRASASIVALRAGDGCYVWTLADAGCTWYEQRVQDAVTKIKEEGYTAVHETPAVVYSGHGAGRARASTKTAAMSSFADVVAFYEEQGIVGNVAPGVLGDNPRIAYNDVPTILSHLPLHLAATKSQLATRVTYKEGIVTWPKTLNEQCADYIAEVWSSMSDTRKLWLDATLCLSTKQKEVMQKCIEERESIYTRIAEELGFALGKE